MQTGLSLFDLSKPGVQTAFVPQGFGEQRSCGTNGRQLMKGSPVISRGQLQIGVRPRKLQSAPVPQAPSQGFLEKLRIVESL